MQFVVAIPGIAPEASSYPSAAERPENQLAVSTVVPPGVADGQEATLSWAPGSSGEFPVILIVYYRFGDDCSTPPPAETDPADAAVEESELTTVNVI